MKVAVFTGVRGLEIQDTTRPVLNRSGDVILRVDTVGVCGSDVHYYTEGRIGDQTVEYPATLGHECSGTVVDVGSKVTDLRVGERVAVDPAISCGQCDQCWRGRPHTCRKLFFLGCPGQAPGAAAEYIAIPSECCFRIPDSMSLVQAALVEPLSVAVYAQRLARMQEGAVVAILGAGPIGLCVLMTLRAVCPGRAYVTDLLDGRLELAMQSGADWGGMPTREDIVKSILAREPAGLDYVFECAGEQETLDQATELLKPGGTLMMIGIPNADRVSFQLDPLRRKELCLQNVRRQNGCMAPAIDLVARGVVAVDPLVTHHFQFDETKSAFDLVADYADGVVKAVIHVSADAEP